MSFSGERELVQIQKLQATKQALDTREVQYRDFTELYTINKDDIDKNIAWLDSQISRVDKQGERTPSEKAEKIDALNQWSKMRADIIEFRDRWNSGQLAINEIKADSKRTQEYAKKELTKIFGEQKRKPASTAATLAATPSSTRSERIEGGPSEIPKTTLKEITDYFAAMKYTVDGKEATFLKAEILVNGSSVSLATHDGKQLTIPVIQDRVSGLYILFPEKESDLLVTEDKNTIKITSKGVSTSGVQSGSADLTPATVAVVAPLRSSKVPEGAIVPAAPVAIPEAGSQERAEKVRRLFTNNEKANYSMDNLETWKNNYKGAPVPEELLKLIDQIIDPEVDEDTTLELTKQLQEKIRLEGKDLDKAFGPKSIKKLEAYLAAIKEEGAQERGKVPDSFKIGNTTYHILEGKDNIPGGKITERDGNWTINGMAQIEDEHGTIYRGNVVDNKKEGQGSMQTKAGNWIIGVFKNDEPFNTTFTNAKGDIVGGTINGKVYSTAAEYLKAEKTEKDASSQGRASAPVEPASAAVATPASAPAPVAPSTTAATGAATKSIPQRPGSHEPKPKNEWDDNSSIDKTMDVSFIEANRAVQSIREELKTEKLNQIAPWQNVFHTSDKMIAWKGYPANPEIARITENMGNGEKGTIIWGKAKDKTRPLYYLGNDGLIAATFIINDENKIIEKKGMDIKGNFTFIPPFDKLKK